MDGWKINLLVLILICKETFEFEGLFEEGKDTPEYSLLDLMVCNVLDCSWLSG